MQGFNVAVVGLLAVAFYSPVWTGAVLSKLDFAVTVIGFVLFSL
jgi:chromate transporter